MCKSTKHSTRAITSLLYIITLCRLIYFWMKLLFCSSMAIRTRVTTFTITWFAPFISMFYARTRSRPKIFKLIYYFNFVSFYNNKNMPVLVFSWISSLISTIMILRTCISLSTKSRRALTLVSFII